MSNKEIENLPICLLAAAPAMLEALEEFVRVMESPGTTVAMPHTVNKAKAAIRLAKGESHV